MIKRHIHVIKVKYVVHLRHTLQHPQKLEFLQYILKRLYTLCSHCLNNLDKNLSLTYHINETCKKATNAIRSKGRIRKYITKENLKLLVNVLVISRLDYCNSILYGLPKQDLDKLQRIQDTTARLITGSKRYEHIKPALRELHWLPVESRIIFKVLLITFKIIHGLCPAYLSSLLQLYQPQRSLRSSSKLLFTVPTVNSATYGERAFSFSAPKNTTSPGA